MGALGRKPPASLPSLPPDRKWRGLPEPPASPRCCGSPPRSRAEGRGGGWGGHGLREPLRPQVPTAHFPGPSLQDPSPRLKSFRFKWWAGGRTLNSSGYPHPQWESQSSGEGKRTEAGRCSGKGSQCWAGTGGRVHSLFLQSLNCLLGPRRGR